MNPGKNYKPGEIINIDWTWSPNENRTLTNEGIGTAALVAIARTLCRIEQLANSLGADGLHSLIRLAAKKERRVERARCARDRARRKAGK